VFVAGGFGEEWVALQEEQQAMMDDPAKVRVAYSVGVISRMVSCTCTYTISCNSSCAHAQDVHIVACIHYSILYTCTQ
jgi:hypothetical protein